jgi:GDP-4-dehydro-6-deoxy-D-mannose reductase
MGHAFERPTSSELDLLDAPAVSAWVEEDHPDAVFHLAALASVGRSWDAPDRPLRENVTMTLNVLEAVRCNSPTACVLVASSAEVYGPPQRLPIDESHGLRPQNPYAVSKAACDLLAGQYADAHGLHVVRTRAFNHAGPGQGPDYVLGTLTQQLALAELEGREAVLRTGNPNTARDFTDVRDVVRAYVGVIDRAPDVYNVCSGRAVKVRALIEMLRAHMDLPIRHELDPQRMRPNDVPEVWGSAERLAALTGWAPQIPLETTVADALDSWRRALKGLPCDVGARRGSDVSGN